MSSFIRSPEDRREEQDAAAAAGTLPGSLPPGGVRAISGAPRTPSPTRHHRSPEPERHSPDRPADAVDESHANEAQTGEPSKPSPIEKEPEYEDVAMLFLGGKIGGRPVEYGHAKELLLKAWDVHDSGRAGHDEVLLGVNWSRIRWTCLAICLPVLVLTFLLVVTRAMVRLVNTQDGLLVGTSLPAFPGTEAVVATGVAVQERSLTDLSSASAEVLRNVRDVNLVHDGSWRCIRIARSQILGEEHILLEAADGTAIRVQHGSAFLRMGALGQEEPIDLAGAQYEDASNVFAGQLVVPSALVNIVTAYADR